jgi:flavin-dependent dehydrogenase
MADANTTEYDVAIVGGGPVGSTISSFLKKYNPDLRIVIIEKEKFPRDHVGESQLPSISPILHEMGVWEDVEAAGFPIKIGASYTWGKDLDQWDFDFYPVEQWRDEPRPSQYEGQRKHTAFQVDRAIYDNILLDKAKAMGVEVREETRVDEILVTGKRVDGFRLHTGETITAKYYIDGSGAVALLRRALGVESDAPTALRNIAIWDYWKNAEWAVEIGVGATRVQVRSLPYGWMWFIPLGPTRTSIGLICPSEYYKNSGMSTEEIYLKAISDQETIAKLTKNAQPEGSVQSCKDWSHLAHELVGENWFLCGESAGFADPILAAGLSLAHSSAREAAYAILELERGEIDADWIKTRFNDHNRNNISQHIRFAQYWYSANGCFTDLQEHCSDIAEEAGLTLAPNDAWRWLSQGGFATESIGLPTFGSFDIASAKQVLELFDSKQRDCDLLCNGHNVFKLNLHGAELDHMGSLSDGRIERIECWRKGSKRIPNHGIYKMMLEVLKATSDGEEMIKLLKQGFQANPSEFEQQFALVRCIQALEVMIQEGWVLRSKNKKRPMLNVSIKDSKFLRSSTETQRVLDEEGSEGTIKSNL